MVLTKEVGMTSIVDGSMKIQTTSESNPSTPAWFGEVVLLSSFLRKHGVLSKISEQVRFARVRLRHQWRAHPGGVLRAAPALCSSVHGVV